MTEPHTEPDAETATSPVAAPTPPVPGAPAGPGPVAPAGASPTTPVTRRRRPIAVATAVLIIVVVLVAAVVVTVLLTVKRGQTGKGDASPTAAVNDFLGAIYANNPDSAAKHVCAQALDGGKLSARIAAIAVDAARYGAAAYRWDSPVVTHQTSTEATVTTTVRLNTGDERTSSQPMTITTISDNGWWVCEVSTGGQ